MLGNDIVDIKQTRISSNWRRKGFLQKVFTPKEQEYINKSLDPFSTVWRMWSMKESAYKLYIQQGHERFFNPVKLVCTILSDTKGEVCISEVKMQTRTESNSTYIFTTATLQDDDGLENSIFHLPHGESQSEITHQKIRHHIAAKNRLKIDQLSLRKTSQNIPHLFYRNQKLPISFSLTHHGNYGAFSIIVAK